MKCGVNEQCSKPKVQKKNTHLEQSKHGPVIKLTSKRQDGCRASQVIKGIGREGSQNKTCYKVTIRSVEELGVKYRENGFLHLIKRRVR